MRAFGQISIVLVILVLIITLDIITSNITEDCIEEMLGKIENISKLIDENREEAINSSNNIMDEWEELENKMNYYLEHNEIEKVSREIAVLNTQIEIDKIQDAKENISEIKFLLEHVREKPKLRISNIF